MGVFSQVVTLSLLGVLAALLAHHTGAACPPVIRIRIAV
jgi:hypothetical protein